MRARTRWTPWVASLVLGLASLGPQHRGVAEAQEQGEMTREQARSLFRDALALVAAGDYVSAVEKLEQAASYKRTPQIVYTIALCHEKMGKLVQALGEYRIALADAQNDAQASQVAAEAQAAIASLEPRVPTLRIVRGEELHGVRLRIDGRQVETAKAEPLVPVDPGVHMVEATAPGFEPFRQEITLTEGAQLVVEVRMKKKTAAPTPPAPRPAPEPSPAPPHPPVESSAPVLGYVALGVGVAGAATATVFYLRRQSAISKLDDQCGPDRMQCPPSAKETYDAGRRDHMIASFGAGIGLVGLVGGTIVLLSHPGSPAPSSARPNVQVVPMVSDAMGGVGVDGRF